MKTSKRELIFFVLLLIIPVSAWWVVIRPQNICNEKTIEQIKAKQTKLQALNRVTAAIGDLKKEIASQTEAIEYFQSKLPSTKEIDKVLGEVWRLAEANRLVTKSIKSLDKRREQYFTTPGSRYAEQPIKIELRGNFMGLYSFLQALENQPRIMRIHKMDVKKPTKAAEGDIEAEITMSVSFEQDQEDPSNV